LPEVPASPTVPVIVRPTQTPPLPPTGAAAGVLVAIATILSIPAVMLIAGMRARRRRSRDDVFRL
jgi:hypothetical protein